MDTWIHNNFCGRNYHMKRSALVSALAALFITAFVFTAAAADYPSRPFEFLAPAGAGGGWDTTIRMVGTTLGDLKIISQPMPVTNKPGGGGAVKSLRKIVSVASILVPREDAPHFVHYWEV